MPVHQQRSPDAVKQSPGLKHQPLLFCVYTLFKKKCSCSGDVVPAEGAFIHCSSRARKRP